MTDWQIDHLYIAPAANRAEEFQKDMPTPGGSHPVAPVGTHRNSEEVQEEDLGEPGSPAHRNWHLSAYMNGPLGISPEKARQMYDRQLAQWKVEQNGKG